ncbi:MAG: hypothetical protein M0Q44_04270 [Methylobacter sp.]|nr:hypothetical protein [Methylobacter sp.]
MQYLSDLQTTILTIVSAIAGGILAQEWWNKFAPMRQEKPILGVLLPFQIWLPHTILQYWIALLFLILWNQA